MEFNVKGDAQVTATGVAAALLKCCHSTLRRLYRARVHSSSLHDPSTTHEAAHYVGRRATRHVPDGEVLQPEPVQRTRHPAVIERICVAQFVCLRKILLSLQMRLFNLYAVAGPGGL